MITSNEMSLRQRDDVINNEGKVLEFFSNGCLNVKEITVGKKPLSVLNNDNATFSAAINVRVEEHKYHPSLLNIKKHFKQAKCFSFSVITTMDVLKSVKPININKTM